MRSIKAQYFLTYAVLGSLLPYLPVFFAERGLNDPQIGWASTAAGWAVLVTPVVVTLLADTRLRNRTLLAWSFGLAGAAVATLALSAGFWPVFLIYTLHALAFAPVVPVLDGLNFAEQRRRDAAGLATVSYHRVRVWGTLGFIVPSLILYVWLRGGAGVGVTVVAAVIACALGVTNALLLPGEGVREGAPRAALPTAAAARTLLRPQVAVFCLALWLVHLATSAYYAFYPLYLTRRLGVDAEWIGLISNLGVVVEIGFMLGFGLLVRRLGLRWLMVVGAACMAARFALLWLFPNVPVAVGTQALHGIMVLIVHVAPPVYLNSRAGDAYRNSVQGLYAMAVVGTGRIVGNAAAGYVAEVSLTTVFAYAAALAVVTTLLFAVAFREPAAGPAPCGR